MIETTKRCLLFLLVAMASFEIVGWCQSNLGGVTGRVSDPSGGAIPEAVVTLTSLDSGRTLTAGSSTEGIYSISGVAPGRYRISVTKAGFKGFSQEPIFISTATVITLDINLAVGEVSETLSVTAEALGLQTTSVEIGTVMPQQAMLDLPISLGGSATIGASGRRQIENFTFLTPGVQGNQWSKSVNGAPGFAQEILIDGFSMTQMWAPGFVAPDTPPYEAIGEFKMQNTLYPAEYGGGLGVENFTLKSGGSEYHGNLFEFLRNDKFDARGFFARSKNILRQNEYGGTFGGPLDLPKIYDSKGRTFFFGAYTGFKRRGGTPGVNLITLPTAQQRLGDFSDFPFPIFDPVCGDHRCSSTETRQQFSHNGRLNVIPPNRISEVAKRVVGLLPSPDFPGYVRNYVDRSYSPTNDWSMSIKIDHAINDRQRISGAWWETRLLSEVNGPVAGPLNPNFYTTHVVARGLRFNHTHAISPTLLNHIGYGYSSSTTFSNMLRDERKGNKILQIPGIPEDSDGFSAFAFLGNGGYPLLGNTQLNGVYPTLVQHHSWADNLTWVKGKHQVKVGGLVSLRSYKTGDHRFEAGEFDFHSNSTSQPNDPANFARYGNSFASFLLGEVSFATRAINPPVRFLSDQLYALYAEDSIKITPKLTVTLGLRYELPVYVKERNGNISYLSLTRPNEKAGGRPGALIFLGDGPGRTGTRDMFGTYRKSFSPRVGIAYQLNNKTVVRMGYGIFRYYPNYGRLNQASWWANGFGAFPSFSSLDQGIRPAFSLDSGFPATNITLPNVDPTQLNNSPVAFINGSANKPSTTQSWTVGIQRELPFNVLLDASYVGSNSTGLWSALENLNQVHPSWLKLGTELNANISCLGLGTCPNAAAAGVQSPYPGFNATIAQALRPYPQYTRIDNMYQPTGYNTYHSLQVRLQKRFSDGLSFLGSYTLSKNIGAVGGDTFGDAFGGGGFGTMDTFNRHVEKALLPLDQTHVFVLSWSYAVPVGRGKRFLSSANGVLNQLLGGWQLNAIQTYRSAAALAIGGGPSLPIFGGAPNRPNWNPAAGNGRSSVSMGDFDPRRDKYLVITPWSQPPAFTFGNGPRRQPNLRGPAFYDEGFSIFKRFSLGSETRYLEFRSEFFNLFNRVVFGGPNTNTNDPINFGIIGGQANTPRVIQFALKLIF
ncbi:MAG: TonB-dependent receptor [Acidobacteriota bacterium]